MAYKLITAPTSEPITKADVYLQCRIDSNAEDSLLDMYIKAAREEAEHRTNRKFLPQTWELALDAFPSNEIKLPFAPIASIFSVKYLDINGATQTIAPANYTLDNYGIEHFVLLAANQLWPTAMDAANSVKIQFIVGYTDVASVPTAAKQWMLLAISTWYKYREMLVEPSGRNAIDLPRDFAQGLLDTITIPSL